MRLVLLWRRIGPYHRARLEAAGKLGDLWCIEGGGADRTYAWDKVTGADSFRRLTLFPDADSGDMPPRILQQAVSKALDQVQPTVVAVPGWEDKLALAALRWSIKAGTRAITMSDTHRLAGPPGGIKDFAKRRIVVLCQAGFVSGSAAADYLARLGMPRGRIYFGYDVADNGHFANGADGAKNEGERELRPGRFPAKYFLSPARFIWQKNLPLLLEAYARYRGLAEKLGKRVVETEPWPLVLVGDGPLRSEVEASISRHGVERVVHLLGFRQYDELPRLYALAQAVILPSVSETWGLVVNEAMACGLPVLVSNRCGCAPDLVREGVNGFTFDPLDVDQLAQLMLRLWSVEPDQLHRMGEASRQIISHWSPELFARNLWKAAETAIALPRPRPTFLDRLLLWALLYLR